MSKATDSFLAHYGVVGMKWGKRGAAVKSGAAPSFKELRAKDKVARGEQNKAARAASDKNDAAIKRARTQAPKAQAAIKVAKKQYKEDKYQHGKVRAKEILKKNTEKPYKTLGKSREDTRREANARLIADAASTITLHAILTR